jgi:hypothetical protein
MQSVDAIEFRNPAGNSSATGYSLLADSQKEKFEGELTNL